MQYIHLLVITNYTTGFERKKRKRSIYILLKLKINIYFTKTIYIYINKIIENFVIFGLQETIKNGEYHIGTNNN